MADKKSKKTTEQQIKIAKKDTAGLFTGKFKTQTFDGKKDKLEKELKKTKQKGFEDNGE